MECQDTAVSLLVDRMVAYQPQRVGFHIEVRVAQRHHRLPVIIAHRAFPITWGTLWCGWGASLQSPGTKTRGGCLRWSTSRSTTGQTLPSSFRYAAASARRARRSIHIDLDTGVCGYAA